MKNNNTQDILVLFEKLYRVIDISVKTNSDKWKLLSASAMYILKNNLIPLSKRLFYIIQENMELIKSIKIAVENKGLDFNDFTDALQQVEVDEKASERLDNKNWQGDDKSLKMAKKPKLSDVIDFVDKENLEVDAERFFHHYNAMGFRVLGNPIFDWRSKVREWDMREKQKQKKKAEKESLKKEREKSKTNKSSTERNYSEEEIVNQNLFSDLDNIEI